jgi:diphthamide synthase (EF-2-diphthine--ammonia ligase)
MAEALDGARADGIAAVAFGDLFLEDVRRYREDRMRRTGIAPCFPLWGRDTRALAREMIAGGLRARITCVDPRQLDPAFVGRPFEDALLADLPPGVDPCGEHGEFHTCVVGGPMFRRPIDVRAGETVERDGFFFSDLLPAGMVGGGREASP